MPAAMRAYVFSMVAVPGAGDRMAWFAPALLVSALIPALYLNGIRWV